MVRSDGIHRPAEHRLGDVILRPDERRLSGPSGQAIVEPRVIDVLLLLSETSGRTVSRVELFERCWGSALAGDDSLNRAIYQLRKALTLVGTNAVSINTVAALGYVLQVRQTGLDKDCLNAARSWRLGLGEVDRLTIQNLQQAIGGGDLVTSDAWGLLALMLCRAVEYADPNQCIGFARQAEEAAHSALAIDAFQPDAQVALAALMPIYGDWIDRRIRLQAVLQQNPDHFPARHEMAVLEMATGRISAAIPMIEALMDEDPLAPILHYKRGYHLYCMGRLDEMDRVLDNALQLWPRHPALWQARTMTLAFTGRAVAALELLRDDSVRPTLPPHTLEFHQIALRALIDGDASGMRQAVSVLQDRARWQSLAVAAIMYLCELGAADEALAICERYYLRDGDCPVRLRHEPVIEVSIQDLHRRATQPLFLPVTTTLREQAGFGRLCERSGLTEYWTRTGLQPDFVAA